MQVRYAEDTTGWADWQHDYRLGLLLIMPPPEISGPIDDLRAKYDPASHASCAAHISVSDPLRREMTSGVELEIRAILHSVEPFTLHFDRPEAVADHAGVECLVRPVAAIAALKAALHSASAFEGHVYHRRTIPPHMTIAERISRAKAQQVRAELHETGPHGAFLCDRLEFIVPDDDMCFRRCGTFLLGQVERGHQL